MQKKIIIVPSKISISVSENLKSINNSGLCERLSDNIFNFNNEKFHINFKVVSGSDKVFKINNLSPFGYNYNISKDAVYFHKKYSFFHVKLLVRNINKNSTDIFVNKQYFRLIKLQIGNLYPVGVHLNDLLSLKVIANDDLIVYGASLFNANSNDAFLVMAPSGTGKTYTTYSLLKNGYKFLGEDLSYYDSKDNKLFCVPNTYTWEHCVSLKISDIFLRIPFISLFINLDRSNILDVFGEDVIKKSAKIKRIYLLEKSKKNEIIKINPNKKLFNKILNIQRNRFSYYKNPLLRAFDYFNKNPCIEALYKKEAVLLKKLLETNNCFLVLADNYKNFHIMINKNELSNT